MSTQLEALGIELIEGYDPAQLATWPAMPTCSSSATWCRAAIR